jgi:hypothetical protein
MAFPVYSTTSFDTSEEFRNESSYRVAAAIATIVLLSVGCCSTPAVPPSGLLLTSVEAHLSTDVDGRPIGTRSGDASVTTILGIVPLVMRVWKLPYETALARSRGTPTTAISTCWASISHSRQSHTAIRPREKEADT